jgi:uncharacterized protein YjiS (DUF1127 family)
MLRRFLRSKMPGASQRQARPLYVRLSDADLIDMGIKRYQLEAASSRQ